MSSENASLLQLIQNRRSIRRYQPRKVPADLLMQLLEAAVWAPSAHNRQPWRFAIIEQPAAKQRLARAMGGRLRADLTADGVDEALIAKDVTRSYERLTQAPLLIILNLSMEDMDSYPDDRRSRNEYLMAVQSTAMAAQNLLLAAHACGLGACWMCAPLFVPDLVRDALNLPADWQPQAIITVGYPAEQKVKKRRPPIVKTVMVAQNPLHAGGDG